MEQILEYLLKSSKQISVDKLEIDLNKNTLTYKNDIEKYLPFPICSPPIPNEEDAFSFYIITD